MIEALSKYSVKEFPENIDNEHNWKINHFPTFRADEKIVNLQYVYKRDREGKLGNVR